ncbi:hypothetical protein FC84_GL001067 [Lapidilactobacillus dextrinicus DSM 20335]|uniref:Endonuclease/exonuclease/phosphatase domain-containing protein n=1 Tax=Lapidilactobacillus dextrinicus DSM 20335 TaxID=1423738 RepID=A0A0R2BJA3_9LACO|nr:endonuclease/exonuclease/phosphatase family protein [Lapidilactobacillus dextrinicus]KRM79598.1 hypothetical protein FC84_GL001067 [Lapidilactobacillus dextrinicus DSM 20335]QFG47388.1 endonuclease/exonuclease/phosphatase family protein [Lapidilactobacillus dextrinicus]
MLTINVGTYNIAAGKLPDTQAINRLLRLNKLAVVGLQEVDQFTARNHYSMTSAIAEDTYHHFFTKAIDLERGTYGIALLSDQNIITPKYAAYHAYGLERQVWQKITYSLTTSLKIAIYNTHLSFENIQLRKQQVAELLMVLKNDPNPYKIILSDFNMDQNHDEWEPFKFSYILANGVQQWFETFNDRDENMNSYEIDNIILSKNLKLLNATEQPQILSDHNLLTAKICLNEFGLKNPSNTD